MENTIENKARFFAQYYGQNIVNYIDRLNNSSHFGKVGYEVCRTMIESDELEFHLELKPLLTQITDEDNLKIASFVYAKSDTEEIELAKLFIQHLIDDSSLNNDELEMIYLFDDYHVYQQTIDYLRSRGYALPYMGLSVEKMIEYGWVKLKED